MGACVGVPVFWFVSFPRLLSLLAVFVSVGGYELFVGFLEGEDGFGDIVCLVFGGVFIFAFFGSVPFREGEFSNGEVFAVGGPLVFPDAGSEGSDLVSPEGLVGDVDFWNSLLVVLHVCFTFVLFSSRFFVPLDECFGGVEHGLAACSAVRWCFFSGSWRF